ncbi:transmembrane protein, putative (macronuclear) [Tetrahymena thermophila SB210]|uniref:Transmembrane protein, putative n=1 Tax=Tetrahymena thermophila (strain SB210) TaxID=312017 RepID=W7XCY8_TETTS|nr:transmembrane protein, putative [Tetrahymena thermophila SB210]EWS75327.1 transmembrane protein, putative [Tetrahymena thermophila SB210]|eukprot:XP_012652139.1 transmembrane protein, putative [Tetrahymena thermophila SB210]
MHNQQNIYLVKVQIFISLIKYLVLQLIIQLQLQKQLCFLVLKHHKFVNQSISFFQFLKNKRLSCNKRQNQILQAFLLRHKMIIKLVQLQKFKLRYQEFKTDQEGFYMTQINELGQFLIKSCQVVIKIIMFVSGIGKNTFIYY